MNRRKFFSTLFGISLVSAAGVIAAPTKSKEVNIHDQVVKMDADEVLMIPKNSSVTLHNCIVMKNVAIEDSYPMNPYEDNVVWESTTLEEDGLTFTAKGKLV